jgi:hypothetical protein
MRSDVLVLEASVCGGQSGARSRTGAPSAVEPGVYPRGAFGVRSEDLVIARPDGPEVLDRNRQGADGRRVTRAPGRCYGLKTPSSRCAPLS